MAQPDPRARGRRLLGDKGRSSTGPSKVINAMTIDVEEWFHPEAVRIAAPIERWPSFPSHIERQVSRLLDLLDEAETRATFFVLGQVARGVPRLIRAMCERGHEVASHGDGHQMITDLEPEAFRRDLVDAKATLEDITGRPVLGYRAPTFSVMRKTWWALDIIEATGHRYDSSIYPIHHDRYGIPDSPRFPYRLANGLAELPGSTVRFFGVNVPFGGGGYLRLLPLVLNTVALTYLNEVEKRPFVVYLHPWETDPMQPRLELPMTRRYRHYGNVATMLDRLRSLLASFRFDTAVALLEEEGLINAGDR